MYIAEIYLSRGKFGGIEKKLTGTNLKKLDSEARKMVRLGLEFGGKGNYSIYSDCENDCLSDTDYGGSYRRDSNGAVHKF